MTMRREQRQDQHSRAFYELSNMVFNLLRSPPTQIPFSDQFAAMPPAAASRRRSPAAAKMTPAGFASLLLGVSLALMLCGSVTFFIGFILMPWVLGLVMVFYVAGIVSMIAMLGRWFLCFAAGPPPHRKDIPGQIAIWSARTKKPTRNRTASGTGQRESSPLLPALSEIPVATREVAPLRLRPFLGFLLVFSAGSLWPPPSRDSGVKAGSPTPPPGDSAVKGNSFVQLQSAVSL
ncbi:hypothetical protein LINPERPRIM_LOCUS22744 [Linum perenne]